MTAASNAERPVPVTTVVARYTVPARILDRRLGRHQTRRQSTQSQQGLDGRARRILPLHRPVEKRRVQRSSEFGVIRITDAINKQISVKAGV